MCGRYVVSQSADDLAEEFGVDRIDVHERVEPDYNVAPTKNSPTVLARPPRDAKDADPVRQLRNLKWGLVPSWAKDPKIGNRMINARAETVHEKPAFRRAFATRRLIIPVSGFYEWFPTQDLTTAGKPVKQPFYLRPKAGQALALAGIYEFWRDREKPDDPDAWLTTFTIITTNATDDIGHIHDRMPMTVHRDNWQNWLDPRINDPANIRDLMAPPPPGSLDVYPVSKAVNNVKNNGPQLIDPLPPTH
ncbi:SOS response-associated peptidase [Phytoactinopolyspora mesophila]|uniref:Abasic site processing protein n=1 Tax=Phytoactinopolyspora mesophila TaxID=2650750 RepID=A0A7K3MAJ6_9ACTN|nr:SOS response-associated peptidase [Phytoactinopolyspora mesophila]NDL60047.1 SOS response-associated peptidase [Phytoactinopolyspora mesophila]